MEQTILQRLSSSFDDYPRGGRAVAKVVLENPERVLCMSLVELSARAGVSDPTVLRFCRLLGFAGYKDFKQRLSVELGAVGRGGVSAGMYAQSAGTFDSIISWYKVSFDTLIDTVSRESFSQAVGVLLDSRCVLAWGVGRSATLVSGLIDKLGRRGKGCIRLDEHKGLAAYASEADPWDVFFILSHDTPSNDIIRQMRYLTEEGLSVIYVGAPDERIEGIPVLNLAPQRTDASGLMSDVATWAVERFMVDALTIAIAWANEGSMPF